MLHIASYCPSLYYFLLRLFFTGASVLSSFSQVIKIICSFAKFGSAKSQASCKHCSAATKWQYVIHIILNQIQNTTPHQPLQRELTVPQPKSGHLLSVPGVGKDTQESLCHTKAALGLFTLIFNVLPFRGEQDPRDCCHLGLIGSLERRVCW